jgi:hypothetical protein
VGAVAGQAKADTTGVPPDLASTGNYVSEKTAVYAWDGWDGATMYGAGTPADLGVGMAEGEVAAGLLPTASSLLVVGVAGYVGWKIGSTIYKKYIATDSLPTPVASIKDSLWARDTWGGCPTPNGPGSPCWLLLTSSTLPASHTINTSTNRWSDGSGNNVVFCDNGVSCGGGTVDSSIVGYYNSVVATGTVTKSCSWDVPVNAHECEVVRSDAQMQAAISVKPSTSTEYSTLPQRDTTGTFTRPGTLTDANLQAFLDALNARTGSPNVQQRAAIDYVKNGVDPTYPQVIVLQPQVNETYTAYQARLQAAGYVGAFTDVAETTALSGYGPSSVTRLSYTPTGGSLTVLDPVAWPTTSPSLQASTPMTVRYNPSTATPVPTTTAPPPEDTGPAGSPGSIDFSPLNVDWGAHFPFGSFAWIHTLVDGFTSSGSLPCWTISHPFSSDTSTVCVPSNPYRSYSDPIMKLIVIVASIWFAGTWITGWSRGETMDGAG